MRIAPKEIRGDNGRKFGPEPRDMSIRRTALRRRLEQIERLEEKEKCRVIQFLDTSMAVKDEMLRSCRSGILPRWWAVAAGSSSYNKTGSNLKAQLLNRNEYIEKNRLEQQVMGAKDAADS